MTKEEIGHIIKESRLAAGLTQLQVAEALGRPQQTVANWELGRSQPDANTLFSLFGVLGRSVDEAFGFSTKKAPALSGEALTVARGYDGLDRHGKTAVKLILDEEQRRMEEAVEVPSNIIPFVPKQKTAHRGVVTIEVFEEPSAAGPGNYVSSSPASHMEQYPEENIHIQTDYGVVISGHSMEPKYPDKAVVFVKSTQVVEPGEVGIFLLDGQTYIKQLRVEQGSGQVFLHSLNPEYSDIEVSPYADFRPLGKVLGGYDPATGKAIWK